MWPRSFYLFIIYQGCPGILDSSIFVRAWVLSGLQPSPAKQYFWEITKFFGHKTATKMSSFKFSNENNEFITSREMKFRNPFFTNDWVGWIGQSNLECKQFQLVVYLVRLDEQFFRARSKYFLGKDVSVPWKEIGPYAYARTVCFWNRRQIAAKRSVHRGIKACDYV